MARTKRRITTGGPAAPPARPRRPPAMLELPGRATPTACAVLRAAANGDDGPGPQALLRYFAPATARAVLLVPAGGWDGPPATIGEAATLWPLGARTGPRLDDFTVRDVADRGAAGTVVTLERSPRGGGDAR